MVSDRDKPVEPGQKTELGSVPQGKQSFQDQHKDDLQARATEDARHNALNDQLPKVKITDITDGDDFIPVDGLSGESVRVQAIISETQSSPKREPWSSEALAGIAGDSVLAISLGAVEKMSKDVKAVFSFISQTPEAIQNFFSQPNDAPVDPRNPISLIATLPKCREAIEAYAQDPSDDHRKELTRSVSQAFKWGDVGEALLNTMCDTNEAKHLNDAVLKTMQPHMEALKQFCVERADAAGKTMADASPTIGGINLRLDGAILKYALKPSEETAAEVSKHLVNGLVPSAAPHEKELAQEYIKTMLAPNDELRMKHAEEFIQKSGYAETRNALVDYQNDPSEQNRFHVVQSLRPSVGTAAGDLIENVIVAVAPESAGLLGSKLLGATARTGAEVTKAIGTELKVSEAVSTELAVPESQAIKLNSDVGEKIDIRQPQYQEARTSGRTTNQEWGEADPFIKDNVQLTSKFKESGKEQKLLKAVEGSKDTDGKFNFEKSVKPLAELSDFYTKHGFYSKADQVRLVTKNLQEEAMAAGKVEGAALIPQKEEAGLRSLLNKASAKLEEREAAKRIAEAEKRINQAEVSMHLATDYRALSKVVQEHDQDSLNKMIHNWRRASEDCLKLGQVEKAGQLETKAHDLQVELEKQIREGSKLVASQEKIIKELHDKANQCIEQAHKIGDLSNGRYSKYVNLCHEAIDHLESAIVYGDKSRKTTEDLVELVDYLCKVQLRWRKNVEAYQTALKCRSTLLNEHSPSHMMDAVERRLISIIESTPELRSGATAQEFELYENHIGKIIANTEKEALRDYPQTMNEKLIARFNHNAVDRDRSISRLRKENPELFTEILRHLGYRQDGDMLIHLGS